MSLPLAARKANNGGLVGMEPFQWAMIVVAALSALLTAGGVIAAVTWKISGIEKTLKDAIIEERNSIEHVAREFSEELDVVRRRNR